MVDQFAAYSASAAAAGGPPPGPQQYATYPTFDQGIGTVRDPKKSDRSTTLRCM